MVVHVIYKYKNKYKWLLNVRLACDHLFGKLLFTWLSLVMSMMVSFVLSFFPRDVLDEILNLIESVSEDFPSYSCMLIVKYSYFTTSLHFKNKYSMQNGRPEKLKLRYILSFKNKVLFTSAHLNSYHANEKKML